MILGGGMASLVTAFELTSLPNWKDLYCITIYQQGWRLGGKGASGRNLAVRERSEEHGLHILFGAYENVFRIMGKCYDEMKRDSKEPQWSFYDAVEGHEGDIVMFENIGGEWRPWDLSFPRRPWSRPGDGRGMDPHPSENVRQLTRWARQWAEEWQSALGHVRPDAGTIPIDALKKAESLAEILTWNTEADELEPEQQKLVDGIADTLDTFLSWAQSRATTLHSAAADVALEWPRRYGILAVLAAIIGRGLLRDRVIAPRERWFSIDNYDLRDWLTHHGAWQEIVSSAPIKALYDAVFSPPTYGAGTSMHVLMLATRYKDYPLYKMKAGMGEIIFAPLYRVLKERGVTFKFFHRVDKLIPDGSHIREIKIEVQATTTSGSYEPLIWAGPPGEEMLCFPTEPLSSQFDTQPGRQPAFEDWWEDTGGPIGVLTAGEHFDIAVLGISIGALGHICSELRRDSTNPRFAEMLDAVRSTQTQAFQLWLNRSLTDIGWDGKRTVSIPYAEPFDTFADMHHIIAKESFPDGMVKGLTYHCSSLEDDGDPPSRPSPGFSAKQRERVRAYAETWLKTNTGPIWKGGSSGSCIDWNLLVDEHSGHGADRFRAQHWCAVKHPSDRYVWSERGSVAKRLRPTESGYDNLRLTGDWTLNGASVGCLEAAAMSGIHAARAIDPRVSRPSNEWLPDIGNPCEPNAAAVETAGRAAAIESKRKDSVPHPVYVHRDGELLAWPPIRVVIKMHFFVMEAGLTELRNLCTNFLNLGASNYMPLGRFVVLYCAAMDNIVDEGSIEERDFGIWVPVVASDVPPRVMTFTPYAWVSNSAALVGGRTMYGFPKHVAELGMPESPGGPKPFTADTIVGVKRGDKGKTLTLIRVTQPGGISRSARTDASVWQTTAEAVAAHADDLEPLLDQNTSIRTWKDLMDTFMAMPGMPMVFLKQFPMPEQKIPGKDVGHACYRAVVEAPIEVTIPPLPKGGPLLRRYDVSFLDCYSHQIVQTLGLVGAQRESDGNGYEYFTVPAKRAGWLEFEGIVKPATSVSEV